MIGPGVAQHGILRSYMRRLLLLAALVAALMPAQKYEMQRYVFGLFRKGPKFTSEDSPERQKIQEGHMANINRMAESGALLRRSATALSANDSKQRPSPYQARAFCGASSDAFRKWPTVRCRMSWVGT